MAEQSLNITVNIDDLRKLPKEVKSVIDMAIRYTTEFLLAETVKEAPVDTGRLQTSFDMAQLRQMAYYVGSNVFYRWWVHEGTGIYGPHNQRITPIKAKFLRFEINGQVIYAKSVAGQQPNKYYDRAIETTEKNIDEFIQKAVNNLKL